MEIEMSNSDIYDGPSIDWNVYVSELPEDSNYHADCGHFHWLDDGCPDPNLPCGDYRCCIN